MNDTPDSRAIRQVRDAVAELGELEVHPLDLEDACRRYAEDGYEVTDRLREFLTAYGELTVSWMWRGRKDDLTTSVERTLESAHATPRALGIHAKRLGFPVTLVGTVSHTEESVLLAGDGDIFFFGDAGFQRVANGFENAVRAVLTGDWDKTFFWEL
ncbi:SUKH-3 domain-containing protein [Streptomyces griseoviridis]|jgi:hypothetical protein|uniref:SUKH-3 immunity protein of toxin-antitoxin system n=2 Tax=Streptomyces TaxID=1883 RepID=A0A918L8P5_STRGD|nr:MULTISPECIES: SUKH-3 domain-containing protein [Streptomyces]GGS20128.1 hypothetical protein GCM10010238_05460 [Streptomyces niveoruber]GGU44034.1 hypothetical protein GCM10010259_38610 [Streptomyces daghestanicus]GHI34452.1 hypothetical protein Sdagh_61820 [Streptomyces daghestanicus]